jgi:prevent-host-death family protein
MERTRVTAELVSAYDAKTDLPKLIERVSRGERFVITRHGKPVAQLIPYESDAGGALEATMAQVKSIRSRLATKGVRLSDLLDEDETVREFVHRDHRY